VAITQIFMIRWSRWHGTCWATAASVAVGLPPPLPPLLLLLLLPPPPPLLPPLLLPPLLSVGVPHR
jgi:hypothetical protein